MLIEAEFTCASCGSSNPITVDTQGGRHQQYVEDCQTCCRPNLLDIEVDEATGEVSVEAAPE